MDYFTKKWYKESNKIPTDILNLIVDYCGECIQIEADDGVDIIKHSFVTLFEFLDGELHELWSKDVGCCADFSLMFRFVKLIPFCSFAFQVSDSLNSVRYVIGVDNFCIQYWLQRYKFSNKLLYTLQGEYLSDTDELKFKFNKKNLTPFYNGKRVATLKLKHSITELYFSVTCKNIQTLACIS